MPLPPMESALTQRLQSAIAAAPDYRITFAEFMDWALYDPQAGYYSASARQLGPQGDFITAAHLGHDFGELLGEQLAEMWHHLDCPTPFDIVELGPGQGLIAADVLNQLARQHPQCLPAVRYTLVERSPALMAMQQQRLAPWQRQGCEIRWCDLSEIAPDAVEGCIFSNEWVDALPVHRVVLTEVGLQEQYVTLGSTPDRPFAFTLGPLSDPAIADDLAMVGVQIAPPAYPLGYTTEVNLAALDGLAQLARRLRRGYLLTVDYGYPAHRYYAPSRSQGTLQCYWQQRHHDDPLYAVGQQDITAHVDFTALERQGERCGLTTLGFTQQGLFLMALGLGDRLSAIAQAKTADINQALRRRDALHRLIDPTGLGNFGVLVQGKGLDAAVHKPLKGWAVPPLTLV
ncbi:MAG: class I SAM-dependent methyltransferase [Leptolyngbyaceae cyanobacterium T60_A2020_046]|nr:class I SAM-dependent methyltransferase [Leptolyngbyaceae cyanobacterium T60_A2020_046]